MTPQEFSQKIKAKYPQYKDIDDVELASKLIAKYPEYKSQVTFDNRTNPEKWGDYLSGKTVKKTTIVQPEKTIETPIVKKTTSVISPTVLGTETLSAATGKEIPATKEQMKPTYTRDILEPVNFQESTQESLAGSAKSILNLGLGFITPIIDLPSNVKNLVTGKQDETTSQKLYKAIAPTTKGESDSKVITDLVITLLMSKPSKDAFKVGNVIDDATFKSSIESVGRQKFSDAYSKYLENFNKFDTDLADGIFKQNSFDSRILNIFKSARESGLTPSDLGQTNNLLSTIEKATQATQQTAKAAETVSEGTNLVKTWKDMTPAEVAIQKQMIKNQTTNNNVLRGLSTLITGNKTVGGKKDYTTGKFITPVELTQKDLSIVMNDMDDTTKAVISTSKNPTNDLKNFADQGQTNYTSLYNNMLQEQEGNGVIISGKTIRETAKNTPVYKKISNIINTGFQEGKITVSPTGTFYTSDASLEDFVSAFNDMNKELAKIPDNLTPTRNQIIVDDVNDNYRNWYQNPGNMQKAKASDQKKLQKAIGDIARATLRETMDIPTQGKFSEIANKRAAYTSINEKLGKITAKATNQQMKKSEGVMNTLGKTASQIGLDDIIFFNPARTGIKIGSNLIKQVINPTSVDNQVIKLVKKWNVQPKASVPRQPIKRTAIPQKSSYQEPAIVTPHTVIDAQAQKIGNQFDKVLEFINDFEAELKEKFNIKSLPEGKNKPKRLMKGTEKSGETIYLGQDTEAFKNRKAVELANIKEKYYDLREKYDALESAIQSNPLYPYIKNQATSGEFAGKISDNTIERIGGKIESETGMDVRDIQERFEGLKGLIERRKRMEEELKDIYTDLKAIKNDNFTTIGNKYVSNQDKEDLSLLEGYKGDAEKGSPIEESPKEFTEYKKEENVSLKSKKYKQDLLAEEARKYKTSKDFIKFLNIDYEDSYNAVKSNNADEIKKLFNGRTFHGSNAANKIIEQGYKKDKYWNSGAYFSDTPSRAIDYMKQGRSNTPGGEPGVLINDFSNLKIKQGEGEIVRKISKNDDGMEEYVEKLKKSGYDGIKDGYGETLIWNVDKIKTPETLEEFWKKAQKINNK